MTEKAQRILDYLKSNKHNYSSKVTLQLKFGECKDELKYLEDSGLIIKRKGLNVDLYKCK